MRTKYTLHHLGGVVVFCLVGYCHFKDRSCLNVFMESPFLSSWLRNYQRPNKFIKQPLVRVQGLWQREGNHVEISTGRRRRMPSWVGVGGSTFLFMEGSSKKPKPNRGRHGARRRLRTQEENTLGGALQPLGVTSAANSVCWRGTASISPKHAI